MERESSIGLESKSRKELPINIPSREDIVHNSHLSETIFDEDKYQEYIKSFKKRVGLLREQESCLRSEFNALAPHYEKGSELFRRHYDLVEELLKKFSANIHDTLNQKDLFPNDEEWFLAEDQIDKLSSQVRDLKFALASLYSIGNYQSISLKASQKEQIGPGQYARQETATVYARYDLSPRQTESYFNKLLPENQKVRSQTILVANGMAALTTALSLTKSEKPGSKYVIANNLYFENDHYVEHTASEIGIDNFELFNTEAELKDSLRHDPEIILVEPISNSPEMQQINLESLVASPTKNKQRFILVDYTLTGQNLDLGSIAEQLDGRTTLILTSSLQKMYEQGDDVSPAGMINIVGKNAENVDVITKKLRALRAMLGTSITLPNLLLLQKISPEGVKEYSNSIGRNVAEIAGALQSLDNPIVEKIVTATKNEAGASQALVFYIHFKQEVGTKFIDKIIEQASVRGLQVVDGTSFGFRSTRLTTLGNKIVRFAPGIENPRQIEVMKQIIQNALNELSKSKEAAPEK